MNTIDEAIEAFAQATEEPPNEALRWALDHWDQAAPRFLTMLEAYTDGADESDTTMDALFFIIHLFGDKGDQRAYPLLCRLMLDEERLNTVLGDDATVEYLKGILIKCFNGDVAPLQKVIESPEAESITRGEALLALAWLARDGKWPEASMKDYVRRLYKTMLPREADYIWNNLIVVAAVLGYREFDAESARLIKTGMVPDDWLTLEDLPELLAGGDPVGKKGLIAEEVGPFEDIVTSLAGWPWPDEDDEAEEMEAAMPHVNPLRDVGRNDPCPCGSGKKYKKCCLVAA